jgi:hypothetical protein
MRFCPLLFSCEAYHGTLHCLGTVLRDEGVRGWFKGAWPAMVKAGPATAIYFFVFEEALAMLNAYTARS